MTLGRPVLLTGAFNARAFGGPVPWLVRSSALDALTPEGVAALGELGVVRVVDLRAPGEGGPAAHDVEVRAVPLYEPGAGVPVAGRLEDVMGGVLRLRGHALAAAVAAIAEAPPGAVAVHCTIGKDRTGLVVALALLAAGASEEDVAADYALSGAQVRPHREAYVRRVLRGSELSREDLAQARRLNLDSPPEVIEHVLDHLRSCGGAVAYLRENGLSEEALAALRTRARA